MTNRICGCLLYSKSRTYLTKPSVYFTDYIMHFILL